MSLRCELNLRFVVVVFFCMICLIQALQTWQVNMTLAYHSYRLKKLAQ